MGMKEEEEEGTDMKIKEYRDRATEETTILTLDMMGDTIMTRIMANTRDMNGNRKVREQAEGAQDPQAILKGTKHKAKTLGMATTLVEEEGITPEIEEMMRIGRVGDIEVTEVLAGKEEAMGAPEPIDITLEAIVAADKGEVLENSARRLQAIGSLL